MASRILKPGNTESLYGMRCHGLNTRGVCVHKRNSRNISLHPLNVILSEAKDLGQPSAVLTLLRCTRNDAIEGSLRSKQSLLVNFKGNVVSPGIRVELSPPVMIRNIPCSNFRNLYNLTMPTRRIDCGVPQPIPQKSIAWGKR